MDVAVVAGNAIGDLFKDGRLAGLGGRDDHAALAATDGCDQIKHPSGKDIGIGRKNKLFVGKDRRQSLEGRA